MTLAAAVKAALEWFDSRQEVSPSCKPLPWECEVRENLRRALKEQAETKSLYSEENP